MTTLRELIGKPVVSRGSAETLGPLTGALLDPSPPRIVAWQVGKGRKARIFDHEHVVGVGDAIMLDDDTSARQAVSPVERETVKGSRRLLGQRALSDAGDDLGTVEDVTVDESSGAVTSVRTAVTETTGNAIRGFGTYALVLGAPPA